MSILPLKKRLWQAIVRAKIENQAVTLDACGRAGGGALRAMAKLVSSGDPDNVEARAARDDWSRLFDHFSRGDGADRRNGMLDYGYSVVRAAVARARLLPAACFLASASGTPAPATPSISPMICSNRSARLSIGWPRPWRPGRKKRTDRRKSACRCRTGVRWRAFSPPMLGSAPNA